MGFINGGDWLYSVGFECQWEDQGRNTWMWRVGPQNSTLYHPHQFAKWQSWQTLCGHWNWAWMTLSQPDVQTMCICVRTLQFCATWNTLTLAWCLQRQFYLCHSLLSKLLIPQTLRKSHHYSWYSSFLPMISGLDNLSIAESKTMLNLPISISREWGKGSP